MDTQFTLLCSPNVPSPFTLYLGIKKRLIPLTPLGASGSLARTKCIMFSAISCSPQDMKIFWPLTEYLSPSGVAVVRINPKSVPQ